MSQRTKPPFRADHVGSLLRPAELKVAREKFAKGGIDAAGLKAVEDRAVTDVIKMLQFFDEPFVLTRGGPLNATHLMATLSFQRAIPGGNLGEGAALAIAMVPFLLAAIMFSYFGLQRRAWQHGGDR